MATIGSSAAENMFFGKTTGHGGDRALRIWLFAMAALVLLMVTIGGSTRLTGSGLSITEWQPIMGTLPPLSDTAWQDAFAKYRQIPQYQTVNKGMSMDAFKGIYWWEWAHRFLGRLLGVAFLVPFLIFLWRGYVRGPLAYKLAGLFVLGGLQGALGWYMVASGLSQRTDVSQYRLAAHLTLASALFAALLWTALDIGHHARRRLHLNTLARGAVTAATIIVLGVFVQIGAGALVAGMKAGLAYNTWPLMDGRIIPSGILIMQPAWLNAFENSATVQFDHRMLAYMLAVTMVWHAVRVIRSADDERMRQSASWMLVALVVQIGLGIWTLLAHVPLGLALAHQAMAMLVLAAAVWHRHTLVTH